MIRQAVFLVGGKGTRLGAIARDTPKPFLDIGGHPFIDYLIARAAGLGVTHILLLCGHLADAVAPRYDGRRIGDARIEVLVEPAPAGTAGALQYALPRLDPEFFMANGDSFFDADWRELAQMSTAEDWTGRLLLRASAPGRRSGIVSVDADGRITGFHPPEAGIDGPINAGIYLLRRSLADSIERLPCSIEQDVFPALAAAGTLWGLRREGYFIDIGIPEDFERAQTEIPQRLSGG